MRFVTGKVKNSKFEAFFNFLIWANVISILGAVGIWGALSLLEMSSSGGAVAAGWIAFVFIAYTTGLSPILSAINIVFSTIYLIRNRPINKSLIICLIFLSLSLIVSWNFFYVYSILLDVFLGR